MKELLQATTVPLETLFPKGDTLLHQLAYLDHSELLKCVLKTGDRYFDFLLLFRVGGCVWLCLFYISNRSCSQGWIRTANFDGDTPLAVAIARRSTRVVPLLLDFVSSHQLINCRFVFFFLFFFGDIFICSLPPRYQIHSRIFWSQ